jgi:hypothetical protein
MRKIGSEKTLEAKKKRNTLIISIFILLVLIGGTAGYAFITGFRSDNKSNNPTTEDGATLVGSKWYIPLNGNDFYFTNSPESVKDIQVNITSTISSFNSLPIYISSDNSAVSSEIAMVLGKYASHVQSACYGPCEQDLPEKDCSENLIVWRDAPERKVHQEQKCIFIDGDLSSVDAFLYKILRIN